MLTIQKSGGRRSSGTRIARSLTARAAWIASTFSLMICCAGCVTRVVVIPSDKAVTLLPKGASYTATNDVYLVPPARMQEILHALSDRAK